MNILIKYLAYLLTTNYLCAKLFSFHLRFLSFFSLSSVEPRNYSSKELKVEREFFYRGICFELILCGELL